MLRNLNQKQPTGLGCLILPMCLVDDGVLLQSDGSLMTSWKYAGPDMETATFPEMAALADRLNEAMMFGSGWMFQSNCFRFEADDYPADMGTFPEAITRMIDEERRAKNKQEGARFESEYFLTLTYLPPYKTNYSIEKYFYGSADQGGAAAKALEVFAANVQKFENVFSSLFWTERLGAKVVHHPGEFTTRYDTLLGYYRRCLTHNRSPLVAPRVPVHLNTFLDCGTFSAGLRPRIGGKHIASVAIDGFPLNGYPGILSALDSLSLSYRWSTRGLLLSREEAVKALQVMRRGFAAEQRGFLEKAGVTSTGQIDGFAVECVAEIDKMITEAKRGRTQAAIYSSSVVLLNEDPIQLLEDVRLVEKTIQNSGFSARIEQDNAVESWLGSLPGEGYFDIRRFPMTSGNLTELLPLSSIWSGRLTNPSSLLPPNTPPLMIGVTTGATQFRFHLHVGSVGHFIAIGPTGAGKSTLAALIAAQWFRIPEARVISIDFGRSIWALCKAVGGEYFAPGAVGESGFCPLRNIDQHGELSWAAEWIETLITLHDGPITAVQKNRIAEGLQRVARNPRDERTLTHVRSQIQDRQLQIALDYYVGDGPLAYLFDAQSQTLDAKATRFVGIETEQLLKLKEKAIVPAILNIFHEVENSLDGRPTLLNLDEVAVIALAHPIFEAKLGEWLLTMRKKNCAVGLYPQQISQIAKSKITDVIFDSCPTKIFLPNDQAGTRGADGKSGSRDFYEGVGLNEREIEAIRIAGQCQTRDVYITTPEGRRMVAFDLQPASLAFCGVSGEAERAALQGVMDRYPETWQVEWLRNHKQLPGWADYLTGLQRLYQNRKQEGEESICGANHLALVG